MLVLCALYKECLRCVSVGHSQVRFTRSSFGKRFKDHILCAFARDEKDDARVKKEVWMGGTVWSSIYIRDQGPGQWPEIRDKGRQAPQSLVSRQLRDVFSAFPFSRVSAWMGECRKRYPKRNTNRITNRILELFESRFYQYSLFNRRERRLVKQRSIRRKKEREFYLNPIILAPYLDNGGIFITIERSMFVDSWFTVWRFLF